MTREEVEQAPDRLKRKAAPGSDGLTAEMVDSKVLVDFWVTQLIGDGWNGPFRMEEKHGGAHSKEKKKWCM